MLYFKMNDQFACIELKKKEYPELFENYRHSIFDFRSIQKQRSKQTGTVLALFLFATIASSFLSWGLLSLIPFQGLLESPACQKDCVDTMHKFFVALLGTYFYPVSSLVLSYFSIRYFSKKYFKVPLRMFVFLSFIGYGNFCFQTNKDVFSDKNKVLISHWEKGTLNTNTINEVRAQFNNPQREAANTKEK
ncbi:MAG: hypothetical protein H7Z71_00785 [Moraxellaceae bacterium]|nr:hypothetical protein [Pseudobdellovibrionaceae bacterium]